MDAGQGALSYLATGAVAVGVAPTIAAPQRRYNRPIAALPAPPDPPMFPDDPAAHALAHVAARSHGAPLHPDWRVTLNFHPDRLHAGVPLLAAMAADGVYRSQFETGTSNGGLTAHPGGDRWHWESRMFGQAYDAAPPADRPKYGALNHRHRPEGGSPRFGACHLRLAADVLARTTFCYPDSVFDPVHFGVAGRLDLVDRLRAAPPDDPLDHYIEAHVHGPLRLARDVEALVLDPSFRGTETETLARALPCAVEWHAGFSANADNLRAERDYRDYRGAHIAELATTLAGSEPLTPARIGAAARAGRHDPQLLKKVWHCLARFGNRN
jgi:hypothetical protein